MSLKKKFSETECYGLTQEEIRLGQRYLRKHKTFGRIPDTEALRLFEFYLIGHTFTEIQSQFPQYDVGKIILTAAMAGWAKDRDNMQHTLKDRVQAKVIKSVIEQVDFLTSLLSVNNTEHMKNMQKYIQDPLNNPKPDMRIESIKEYKEVVETLYKIVAGSTQGTKDKPSPLYDALAPKPIYKNKELAQKDVPKTAAVILAEFVESEKVK